MKPTTDQIITALNACAVEEPQSQYPCEDCYIYPLSKGGYMPDGRTCFAQLASDIAKLLGGE